MRSQCQSNSFREEKKKNIQTATVATQTCKKLQPDYDMGQLPTTCLHTLTKPSRKSSMELLTSKMESANFRDQVYCLFRCICVDPFQYVTKLFTRLNCIDAGCSWGNDYLRSVFKICRSNPRYSFRHDPFCWFSMNINIQWCRMRDVCQVIFLNVMWWESLNGTWIRTVILRPNIIIP